MAHTPADPPERKPELSELWDAYKLATTEVHFQVQTNLERTRTFLLLNVGTLSVGLYLLKPALLGLSVVGSLVAAYSIQRGHTYYRATREQLKVLEHALALPADLRRKSTRGMARSSTSHRSVLDFLTIVNLSIAFQLCLALIAATIWWQMIKPGELYGRPTPQAALTRRTQTCASKRSCVGASRRRSDRTEATRRRRTLSPGESEATGGV